MSLFLDSVSNRRNLRLLTLSPPTEVPLIHVEGETFYHYLVSSLVNRNLRETTTSGITTVTSIPSSISSIYDIGNYRTSTNVNEIAIAGASNSYSGNTRPIFNLSQIKQAISTNTTPLFIINAPNDENILWFIDGAGSVCYAHKIYNPIRTAISDSSGSLFRLPPTAQNYNFTKSYFLQNSFQLNYTAPTWNTYKSVNLPDGGSGAIDSSLCESQGGLSERGIGCAFSFGWNGMYRIYESSTGSILPPNIDYININMNFSTSPPSFNYITRIANNGMVWMIYQSSSQIYRKFSPDFGSNWYDQSTISGTFLSGTNDDLRKEFKISANGKNHIIRTSTGIYISTNYGY